MSMSDKSTQYTEFVKTAHSLMVQNSYRQAFANYLMALKLNPEKRREIKEDFVFTMKQWTEECERNQRLDDLFSSYDIACEVYRDCDDMMNHIGVQLFRLGYKHEGACYVRHALRINPSSISARENLENIYGHLVERWHFRMLNDERRNKAFYEAIGYAVSKGYDTVLDIGSGTGLLSMFAIAHGAKTVTACEHSMTMCSISHDVLTANHMDHNVSVINKHSTDLIVPTDLKRVSLVVTETFDAGLFGEHILTTLKHAWHHLLLPHTPTRHSIVIPQKAQLHVYAVQCDEILKKNRFLYPSLKDIDLSAVQIRCSTGHSPEEPYTTETVEELGDKFTVLSSTCPFLSVDFNNIQQVEDLLSGKSDTFFLTISQKGRIDALVMWFDLDLYEDIQLSTSPSIPNCWQQAVFPVFDKDTQKSVNVKQGDTLRVTYSLNDEKLCFVCQKQDDEKNIQTCDRTENVSVCKSFVNSEISLKTEVSTIETDDGMNLLQVTDPVTKQKEITSDLNILENALKRTHVRIDPDLDLNTDNRYGNSYSDSQNAKTDNCIRQLNSIEHTNVCVNSLPKNERQSIESETEIEIELKNHELDSYSNYKPTFYLPRKSISRLNNVNSNSIYCEALLSIKNTSLKDLRLLDITEGVSFLPIQAIKLGYEEAAVFSHENDNEQVETILRYLLGLNDIDNDKISMINKDELDDFDEQEKYDVIIGEMVEPCGVLKYEILEDISVYRKTLLAEGGVIIPSQLSLYGMCIQSDDLLCRTRVQNDTVTLGFSVEEFINHCQHSTQVAIPFSTLNHTKLSESFLLTHLDFNQKHTTNNLPNFLDLQNEISVKVTESGYLHAVVFWFEITVWGDKKICTYDSSSHWKQAAVIMRSTKFLKSGQEIRLMCHLKNSWIDIKLVD